VELVAPARVLAILFLIARRASGVRRSMRARAWALCARARIGPARRGRRKLHPASIVLAERVEYRPSPVAPGCLAELGDASADLARRWRRRQALADDRASACAQQARAGALVVSWLMQLQRWSATAPRGGTRASGRQALGSATAPVGRDS
jgi:hypothetical protein